MLTLFHETAGILNKRFTLVAFVPSVLVIGLLTVITSVSWQGWHDTASAWSSLDALGRTLLTVVVLLAAMLTAVLLVRGTTDLLRLYEGYWTSRPGRRLARLGSDHHRRRLATLAARSATDPLAYRAIHLGYPLPTQPEQVMPTRLGNILRNAELHARDRYGIDAVLIWPRLYAVLPDRMVATVAATRADLDSLVVTSVMACAFAVLSGTAILVTGGPPWLFAACFAAGTVVSFTAYRSAVRAAVSYGQQIKVAFDVYRKDLLAQLAIAIPEDADAEFLCWQQLGMAWYRNTPGAAEEPPPVVVEHDPPGAGLALGTTAFATATVLLVIGTTCLALI